MKTTKKRINSKRKGNRAEWELAKILTKRFGLPFTRVGVSSGARPKQVELDDSAKQVFTSDLVAPSGFRFSVECKAVNVNIDLLAQSALLDKFLDQAAFDATSIGKLPLLCWKRNHKGWIAAVPINEIESCRIPIPYYSRYIGNNASWLICRLDALLMIDIDEFWFDTQERFHHPKALIQNNTRRLIEDDH
jgi:hypothetical protein